MVTGIIVTWAAPYIEWDDYDEYGPALIIAAVIAFFVFRIAIWVFKAFAGIENEQDG